MSMLALARITFIFISLKYFIDNEMMTIADKSDYTKRQLIKCCQLCVKSVRKKRRVFYLFHCHLNSFNSACFYFLQRALYKLKKVEENQQHRICDRSVYLQYTKLNGRITANQKQKIQLNKKSIHCQIAHQQQKHWMSTPKTNITNDN